MALSKVTYSTPGTPRVYIDNFLFARAINMKMKVGGVTVVRENADDNYSYFDNSADNKLLWDLDPVRYITLNNSGAHNDIKRISAEFFTSDEDGVLMKPFLNLMHTTNYAGVFNHNLSSGSDSKVRVDLVYNGGNQPEDPQEDRLLGYGGQPQYINSIVGEFGQEINEDGFILSEISLNRAGDEDQLHQFDFVIKPSSGSHLPQEFSYNIGSFSVGTYLDFPVSPDLSVKQTYMHEGVKTKTTIGGKHLTHVDYYGAPNWATLPPFTTTESTTENFIGTGHTGRKAWDMKFSYVDKTDMFNSIQSGSSAGGYIRFINNQAIGFKKQKSIIGTYLNRTLGGSLRHVLQPDNTRNEFYMVKLDQKSTRITQVAHGVFEVAFKFVQVW
tara:strand:+ start:2383 stop:3537 length:1155 start_codon:yes stop_codon:yes gene_type:complete